MDNLTSHLPATDIAILRTLYGEYRALCASIGEVPVHFDDFLSGKEFDLDSFTPCTSDC